LRASASAVGAALRAFDHTIPSRIYLDIFINNKTQAAQANLPKGNVVDPLIRLLSKQLLQWQIERDVTIWLHCINTKDNVLADALS
jgi:hypothetical protein